MIEQIPQLAGETCARMSLEKGMAFSAPTIKSTFQIVFMTLIIKCEAD
jgi:hypothetical protein